MGSCEVEVKDSAATLVKEPAAPVSQPAVAPEYNFDHLNDDLPETVSAEAPPAPTPTAAPVTASVPKHSAHLLGLAKEKQLGLDAEQIEAMSSDDLMEAINDHVKQQKLNAIQPGQTRRQPQPQQESHPPSLVRAALAIGLEPRQIAALSSDSLTDMVLRFQAEMGLNRRQEATALDEDEEALQYIENEVGADKKLVGLLRKQQEKIKAMEQHLVTEQKSSQQRRQSDVEEAIDNAFEELGPRFEKLFGTGPLRKLGDGPQKIKRLRIYQQAGLTPDDSDRVIKRKVAQLAREMFEDLLPTEQPAKPAASAANAYDAGKPANGHANGKPKPNGKHTPEEWEEAALAAPVAPDPELTPRERTLQQKAQDYMREKGITNRDYVDTYDGVPD